ncbi:uncharacterized protein LOC135683775 isoform X1 [Rhopilema esculentum]|uniref:uncharacterized protein LOC135683775 isoform X1 n=1 Tax=Rhopilema esculentum TaxID=499914 RepID=UPI0031DE76E4
MLSHFRCLILYSLLTNVNCGDLDGWSSLGCWRDLPARAIAGLEGRSKSLTGNWKTRPNALQACANAAKSENLKVFAVQDGGQCFGGPYAQLFYDQYGPSNLCKGGTGGVWSNSVYGSASSYRRVLQSKENSKPIKCSKPLDLVFLVDGSGKSTSENKLRWTEMLRFVARATEMFDPATARFGVISYGSKPKVIVDLAKNPEEIAMRDQIIGSDFPGGQRTVNDALKAAWQEQLKHSKGDRNKVIVAMTTSNMDYGPWGSSLFLTNRGVRLLAFGIDKKPTYRFLESIASGRHPENIYSLDSDQMDKTLPFLTKDICTGAKRSRVETVRKDKEIDFISSREFETVGSVVERPAKKKSLKSVPGSGELNQTKLNNERNETSSASSTPQEDDAKDLVSQWNTGNWRDKEEEDTQKNTTTEGGMFNKSQTWSGNFMYEGSYQTAREDVKTTKTVTDDNKVTNNETQNVQSKPSRVMAVNNSSLSDGDIVEKLKESAVEMLKKNDSGKASLDQASNAPLQSFAWTGDPVLRENAQGSSEWKGKTLGSNEKLNVKYAGSGNGYLMEEGQRNYGNVSAGQFKEDKHVNKTILAENNNLRPNPVSSKENTENFSIKGKKLPLTGFTGHAKNGIKSAFDDHNALGKAEQPEIQMNEGQMVTTLQQRDSALNHTIPEMTSKSNATVQKSNNESRPEVGLQEQADLKENTSSNDTTVANKDEHLEFHGSDNAKSDEDDDKKVFDDIEKQRQSIGEDDEGFNSSSYMEEDQKEATSTKKGDGNSPEGDEKPLKTEPWEDDYSLEEDELATQRALDEKRKEIDILLKKLDETRKRRKKRKVLHRIKGFDDVTSDDDKDFESFENMDDEGHKDGEKSESTRGKHHKHYRQKIKYNKPIARHVLTKHAKKPFRAIPTKKAMLLLDKLYNTESKTNLTVKYDIFDPIYSSNGRQQMTRDSYKTSKSTPNRKGLTGPWRGTTSGKVAAMQPSDKQQMFLRHTIANNTILFKTGRTQKSVEGKRNKVSSRNKTKSRGSDKQSHHFETKNSQNELYQKKFSEASRESGWKANPLENTPLVKMKTQRSVDDRNKLKSVNKLSAQPQNIIGPKSATLQEAIAPLSAVRQRRPKTAVEENAVKRDETRWALRNRVAANANKDSGENSFNLSNFQFTFLSKIDSGNYSIYRVSNHKILVNLQSTTGKLESFYGKSVSRISRVGNGKSSGKSSDNLALDLAMAPKPGNAKRRSKGSSSRNNAEISFSTGNVKLTNDTRFVDNMDYFQSSLETEQGSTRSVHRFKPRRKKARKSKAAKKHINRNAHYNATTERLDNINRTRFDLYDNRLAHVDKPISYFVKDARYRDPDRLIVTENNDPITDSRMVKLFVNSGDENSLMPAGSNGLSRYEGGTAKSMKVVAGKDEDFSDWNKDVNAYSKAQGSKDDQMRQGLNGTVKSVAHKHDALPEEGLMKNGIRKIVETSNANEKTDSKETIDKKTATKSEENRPAVNASLNLGNTVNPVKVQKPERGNKILAVTTARPSKASVIEEKQLRQHSATQKIHASNDDKDVWVFKPDSVQKEQSSERQHNEDKGTKSETLQRNSSIVGNHATALKAKLESNHATEESNAVEEKDEAVISQLGQAVGCTRPVKVLFLIDVSDAIGTGPTRQRKWNHMKRFLRSVNDRVTHSGTMGYIVFDTEPRFLHHLEPCDEKTEYFVTNGECLCDHRAPSYVQGRSSCSTHAPTADENVEDWGKQGPRTAKALQLAQRYFQDPMFGDSKKLVVLITHQASTDDVSAAERSLKDDSISLVDIEIGERHNIKKRSNTFDDVIPRDHQMEVSFYKLDKAIENIFMKICKEKDPTKSRRSRIYATVKRHSKWW